MTKTATKTIACAVYARYSSELQSDTSIEDQLRNCRNLAESKGWSVLEEYLYADRAISGTTTVGRPALGELMRVVESRNRPFDGILVDDTSRLSRDTVEQATLIRDLKDAGVFVYFVSDGIDTRDETTEDVLLPVYGIKDSLYSRDLARKTQRGMAGQVLRGYNVGGRLYGYKYTQELDPSGAIDKKTRQVRSLGTRVAIDEAQAHVVRMIYALYADGYGLKSIAMRLNEKGIAPPRKAVQSQRRDTAPTWGPFTIRAILHNPRYSGDWTWNKKKWFRKRKTGKRVYRNRPETEWVKVVRPELAIIDSHTWERVQDKIHTNARLYAQGVRSPRREYLLSGLLKCHICDSNMTIVSGSNPDKAKYACSFNWRRGAKACPNNIRLSRTEIEKRVTEAIQDSVLNPKSIHRIVELVNARLNQAKPKIQEERDTLLRKAETMEAAIQNLVEFIAQSGGRSSHVVEALHAKETELDALRARINSCNNASPCKPLKIDVSYAMKWMNQLDKLMKGDILRARNGIRQLTGTLTAKPVTRAGATGLLLIGKPQLSGILGVVGAGSTLNGSGGGI